MLPEAEEIEGELGGLVWFSVVVIFAAGGSFAIAILVWLASMVLG
jgi:hypothetical protein